MQKKKIIFVIPSLAGGGAERVVVHLINHLDRRMYDILLVLFENKQDYQKDLQVPLKIICLDKKNRWDFFKLIFKIRKIMHNYNPAVVISFIHYTNILVVLANLFCRMKFNILISERSYARKYLPTVRSKYLKKWLMKLTYRKADIIVAVSKGIGEILREDFNIQSKKIKTIYNPIPVEAIKSRLQEGVERPLFKNENVQVIISVGRLAEEKRFDMLLKAFSLVKRRHEKVHLIILGKGKLREKLEKLAVELKIDKWVDFVGFKSNPYIYLAKADVFVLSSDYEGFPNVILEAMACGTPVISTDCLSGPGEIITNGKNGILVPPEDEKALAEAMLTLLRNKDLRKKFSEEGRKRAEDFRIEKILPQYEELF